MKPPGLVLTMCALAELSSAHSFAAVGRTLIFMTPMDYMISQLQHRRQ